MAFGVWHQSIIHSLESVTSIGLLVIHGRAITSSFHSTSFTLAWFEDSFKEIRQWSAIKPRNARAASLDLTLKPKRIITHEMVSLSHTPYLSHDL